MEKIRWLYVRRPEDAAYLPVAAAAVAAAGTAASITAGVAAAVAAAGISAGIAATAVAAATGAAAGIAAAGIGYEIRKTETGGSPTAGITGIASHKISSMNFMENAVSITSYAPAVSLVTSNRQK